MQSNSGSNKMSVQNLATVFGPNILRAKAEDPQSIVGGKQTGNRELQIIIITEICNNTSVLKGMLFAFPEETD